MIHTEDLELLHALQIAPRASWRALGMALHRSPAALADRWEHLTAEGLAWCTAVPLGRERQGTLVFVALLCEPRSRQQVCDEATLIPDVISIEEPATHWDLILSILTPSIEELLYRILPRITGIVGIARHEIIICTHLHFGGHEWRLDVLDEQKQLQLKRLDRFAQADAQPIRPDDLALLPLLFRDGRASVGELAQALNAHPSTVSRRLNRVLSAPNISLRCDIATEIVGQPISCQWFGWLPPDQHGAAVAALKEFQNLRFCASTTGQTNFTFVLWVNSPEEIFEIERTVVARISQLSISESSVTVRFVKRMGWRLDPQGRRVGEPISPTFLPTP